VFVCDFLSDYYNRNPDQTFLSQGICLTTTTLYHGQIAEGAAMMVITIVLGGMLVRSYRASKIA
jgi:hypothetical protein